MCDPPSFLTVTIRPTADCNLRCKYCYVGEPKNGMMSRETAAMVIEKIVRRREESRTKFLWHGAEPMLAGLDFYRFIVDAEEKLRLKNYEINNSMQTNGTLINDQWAEFFKENDFGVGISLDGPKKINDLTRQFAAGKSSFDITKRGVNTMKTHNIKFGCLVVLNNYNVHRIDEIVDFFKTENIGFEVIPFVPFGRGATRNELSLGEGNYSKAQLRIFQRWLDEGGEVLETAVGRFVKPFFSQADVCTFKGGCQNRFIGVDFDASVYPCNRICDPRFSYGSLLESEFEDILNHPLRLRLCSFQENFPQKCKVCDYLAICNGGCLADKLLEGDLSEVHPLCKEYEKIFGEIKERLHQEIGRKED